MEPATTQILAVVIPLFLAVAGLIVWTDRRLTNQMNRQYDDLVSRMDRQYDDMVNRMDRQRDDLVSRIDQQRDDLVSRMDRQHDDMVSRMDRNHRDILVLLEGHTHGDGTPPAFRRITDPDDAN